MHGMGKTVVNSKQYMTIWEDGVLFHFSNHDPSILPVIQALELAVYFIGKDLKPEKTTWVASTSQSQEVDNALLHKQELQYVCLPSYPYCTSLL